MCIMNFKHARCSKIPSQSEWINGNYLQRPRRDPVLVTLLQSFLVTLFSLLLAAVESTPVSLTDAQPLKLNTATGNSIAIHFFSMFFIPDWLVILALGVCNPLWMRKLINKLPWHNVTNEPTSVNTPFYWRILTIWRIKLNRNERVHKSFIIQNQLKIGLKLHSLKAKDFFNHLQHV